MSVNVMGGEMDSIFSVIFRILIGVIMSAASVLVLSPAFAAFKTDGVVPMLIFFTAFFLVITLSPTVRRAFGRGFIALALAFFALPLSSFLLTGAATVEAARSTNVEGATFLVGGAMTGMATLVGGFVGLVIGGICLIIGVLFALGGRREVIIVQDKTAK